MTAEINVETGLKTLLLHLHHSHGAELLRLSKDIAALYGPQVLACGLEFGNWADSSGTPLHIEVVPTLAWGLLRQRSTLEMLYCIDTAHEYLMQLVIINPPCPFPTSVLRVDVDAPPPTEHLIRDRELEVTLVTDYEKDLKELKHFCLGCRTVSCEEKLPVCAKCKTVRYCSSACQRLHWAEHRQVCSLIGQLRARYFGK